MHYNPRKVLWDSCYRLQRETKTEGGGMNNLRKPVGTDIAFFFTFLYCFFEFKFPIYLPPLPPAFLKFRCFSWPLLSATSFSSLLFSTSSLLCPLPVFSVSLLENLYKQDSLPLFFFNSGNIVSIYFHLLEVTGIPWLENYSKPPAVADSAKPEQRATKVELKILARSSKARCPEDSTKTQFINAVKILYSS